MSRFEIEFRIRYAERVLQRYARYWSRVDVTSRMVSILAGSAAVAAVVGSSAIAAAMAAIVFAVLQAVAHAFQPARRALDAAMMEQAYRRLRSRQNELGDDALVAAFAEVSAEDGITVPDGLRQVAYNDVLRENGCDEAEACPVIGLARWWSWVS